MGRFLTYAALGDDAPADNKDMLNRSLTPVDLPTMPTPRALGMVLLWNPNADLRDFLAVMEGDLGLTASVLRAANSAHSSPVEPVTTARNAIVRIGLDGARQITVAAIARSEFESLEESGLNPEELLCWLLAVGLLTEPFATHDGAEPEERMMVFTAGLLHQIGRLAYASQSPDKYRLAIELVREGRDPIEAEREVFGAESSRLNEQIAYRWSLPSPLLEAITTGSNENPTRLALLIAEAAEVAHALEFDEGFMRHEVLEPTLLAAGHPRSPTVEARGGASGIREQISWFRHATSPRESDD
jgi:HD-like signal output (HDOD) protein